MKLKLKPPGTQRLKLKCDMLLSLSAFKFNLRRYKVDELRRVLQCGASASEKESLLGDKGAKAGVGNPTPLFEGIINSIGDRVEQPAVGHMEKKMNEVHSLVTLIYRCVTHPLESNIRIRV
jgi:hypothetical protein